MVFFNYATMQMAAKIVYYGPGLCGKTTNLHHIYTKTSPGSRGEMVSLETETDRTLFFDLLPIDVGVIGGFKTRLQLYTVPGQVFYNTTRKLVLKGVDGIVFVADSQMAMLDANIESLGNLRENLQEIGVDLDELPLVLQLNKRDLPNIAPVDVMVDAIDPDHRLDYVEAIAPTGVGVFETLKLISKLTLRTLRRRMTGDEPVRPTPPAARAQFKVRDDNSRLTIGGNVAVPVIEEEEVVEEVSEPIAEVEETIAAADIDRHIISSAPVAEPEPAPEPQPVLEEAKAPEPEIEFAETEKPQKVEEKTVKVRSSVDVMAELEALRKRATNTTTAKPSSKRDVLAELEGLKPKRDVHRTVHLQLPQETLSRARSVRVTLSFEDESAGVIETRDQQLELGETTDVQSLSVNLKVDLS
jgi:hypothetical protein